jgi:hypothetical protein
MNNLSLMFSRPVIYANSFGGALTFLRNSSGISPVLAALFMQVYCSFLWLSRLSPGFMG